MAHGAGQLFIWGGHSHLRAHTRSAPVHMQCEMAVLSKFVYKL